MKLLKQSIPIIYRASQGRIGRCFNASSVSCTDRGGARNIYVCRCSGRRSEKLVVRHPHVFGDVQVTDSAQVLSNWDEIKKKQNPRQRKPRCLRVFLCCIACPYAQL